jgi:hypothetical protein
VRGAREWARWRWEGIGRILLRLWEERTGNSRKISGSLLVVGLGSLPL